MKKTRIAAVLTAGALMLSGCGSSSLKKTAIEVGETKVTLADISVMANSYIGHGYDFDKAVSSVAEQIESTLKYGALGEAMGIELTDDERKQVTQMKAGYAQQGGGLSAYKAYLKKAGSSMDFLDKLFTASLYQSKVMEKIDEELGDTEPTEDELKEYFKSDYYRAKHVLIEKDAPEEDNADTETTDSETTDAQATETAESETAQPEETEKPQEYGEEFANEILERAKNGEDFDTLIETYSKDPGSSSNPDGYVFTDGEMVEEFTECVKSLQPGEFGICESEYGYHIIERMPFDESQSEFSKWYEDKKDAVKSAYENKKVEDKFNELCEQYGISSSVNQDVIDSFEEKDMVTPEPTESASTTE